MRGYKLHFLCGGLLFITNSAHSQNDMIQPSAAAVLAQTLVGLFIVVVTIFAFAWVARKLQGQSLGRLHNMELLSVLPLGPKEKAVLVQVKGRSLLLGVAPGRVSALHVFDDDADENHERHSMSADQSQNDNPDEHSLLPKTKALSARTTSEFSQKLQSFLGQGKQRS